MYCKYIWEKSSSRIILRQHPRLIVTLNRIGKRLAKGRIIRCRVSDRIVSIRCGSRRVAVLVGVLWIERHTVRTIGQNEHLFGSTIEHVRSLQMMDFWILQIRWFRMILWPITTGRTMWPIRWILWRRRWTVSTMSWTTNCVWWCPLRCTGPLIYVRWLAVGQKADRHIYERIHWYSMQLWRRWWRRKLGSNRLNGRWLRNVSHAGHKHVRCGRQSNIENRWILLARRRLSPIGTWHHHSVVVVVIAVRNLIVIIIEVLLVKWWCRMVGSRQHWLWNVRAATATKVAAKHFVLSHDTFFDF